DRAQAFYVYLIRRSTATCHTNTLSLHDALPIFDGALPLRCAEVAAEVLGCHDVGGQGAPGLRELEVLLLEHDLAVLVRDGGFPRSEEHTSELQSRENLVCRLMLEKKN